MNPAGAKGDGKGKGGKKKGGKGGSRMANTPADQKVWLGNLSKTTTWKTLQAHLRIAGTTKWVEVDRGSGGASFASAAEALNAIAMLNMSVLDGNQIIVDVWKSTKG